MADLDGDQIEKELLPFLSLETRPDVKYKAMQYFTGLTGILNINVTNVDFYNFILLN